MKPRPCIQLIMGVLSISLFLWGCGGGGSGGGGAGPLIVSGTVQAPNGLVAFYPKQDLLERFANLFVSSADASVSSISPVADGTSVDLVRTNDVGTVLTILATTTTSAGHYSFNLTALGLNFSSDLVVQVVNPNTGAQMQAFVSSEIVNIDPVSETAVRMILDKISTTQGVTLSNFTPQELADLVGSIDLLITVNQTTAGTDLETTVTAIKNLVTADADIMAFIASASAAGQTTEGPGDIGNFFPFAQGDTWNFQGTISTNGGSPVSFSHATVITGTNVINGVTTTVFTETNPDNLGITEEDYFVKDSHGITNWGNNNPTDFITPHVIPYQEVMFPLQLNSTFQQLNKTGVNLGDLDGDGKSEIGNVSSTVTIAAFEDVTVAGRSFASSVKIETKTTVTIMLSRNLTSATITGTQTQWYAPGVGPVKRMSIIQSQSGGQSTSEAVTEEVTSFIAFRQSKAVSAEFTIATGIAPPDSNTAFPGRPGVGFDGTNYLVVSCSEIGSPQGIFGIIVSSSGMISKTFPIISQQGCPAAVAFDGTNYLVVFGQDGEILGTRVSPSGIVLDGPSGFPISSGIPFVVTNFLPAVAFDRSNYLVIWNKFINGQYDIYGSRVTPGGQVLDEIPIFTAPGEQAFPSLAFDGVNYLVAWRDTRTGSGPTTDTHIFGTRVTPGGVVLDPGGIAISTAPGPQGEPQVTFGGTNYFVAWMNVTTLGLAPPFGNIMGRRIMPDGTLLDGPPDTGGIAINTAPFPKAGAVVTFDGTNYLVAWIFGSYPMFPPAGIVAARVSTNGSLLDGPSDAEGILISEPPCSDCLLVSPSILSNGKNSLLVWVNNSEQPGTTKDLRGALIFPF